MDRNNPEVDIDFQQYDSVHGTDHYIMTWDRCFAEPSDVYARPDNEWLAYEYLMYEDLGEDYPRGV